MFGSDAAGCSGGMDAVDSALCVAAAEGGCVVVLAERAGLTSFELFFLDRPGPAEERDEALVLSGGRIGDDSRDGKGEFAAEVVALG